MRTPDKNIRLAVSPLMRSRYQRTAETLPALRTAEAVVANTLGEAGAGIARDLWTGFYSQSEVTDPTTEGQPLRRLLEWAVGEAKKLPEVGELWTYSGGSTYASAEATNILADAISKLELPRPSDQDEVEETTCTNEAGDSVSVSQQGSSVNVRRSVSGKTDTVSKSFADEASAAEFAKKVLDQAQGRGFTDTRTEAADGYASKLEQAVSQLQRSEEAKASFRVQLKEAASAKADELDNLTEALMVAYGDEEGIEVFSELAEDDLAFVQSLQKDQTFLDFVLLVGRFLDLMRSSTVPDSVRGSQMVDGIELTRDFGRLVPAQLSLLASPALRSVQIAKTVAGNAVGYRKRSVQSKAAGPFHIALDNSGSMARFRPQASAFAVAAIMEAFDAGREVGLSLFTTTVQEVEVDLDTTSARINLMRRLCGLVPNGGTDFNPVLLKAQSLKPDADLLLISDGDGPLDVDVARSTFWNRTLNYVVLGGAREVNQTLRDIATEDRTLVVDNFTDGSVAHLAAVAMNR